MQQTILTSFVAMTCYYWLFPSEYIFLVQGRELKLAGRLTLVVPPRAAGADGGRGWRRRGVNLI